MAHAALDEGGNVGTNAPIALLGRQAPDPGHRDGRHPRTAGAGAGGESGKCLERHRPGFALVLKAFTTFHQLFEAHPSGVTSLRQLFEAHPSVVTSLHQLFEARPLGVTFVLLAPCIELSLPKASEICIPGPLSGMRRRVPTLCIEFSVFGNLHRHLLGAFLSRLILYRPSYFPVGKSGYSDR
jgi:hypothetical protein